MDIDHFNNALILFSIYETQKDNIGSDLRDIIAFSDYVNHSIMNFDEFYYSINYLIHNKFIKEKNKKYFVEKYFIEWFLNKYQKNKRIYVFKTVEEIEKYLKTSKNEIYEKCLTKITKKYFDSKVKEYIDGNDLEIYFSGNTTWNNFAKICENIKTNNTEKLLEIFNNDIKLVNVIEYRLLDTSMHWIESKIPALNNIRPIDCINNKKLLKSLKECLLRMD